MMQLISASTSDYVVDAGWALLDESETQSLHRDISMVVRGDRFVEIGDRTIGGELPRLNARDHLVLPGLICGHTHCAAGTPTRGLIESGRYYTRPLELIEALSDDELDSLTALNLADLLRGGATTLLEMSLSYRQMESFVRISQQWGVRAYLGFMIPSVSRLNEIWETDDKRVLNLSEAGTLEEIASFTSYAKRIAGENDLLKPMMSAHAADTLTPASLRAMASTARDLGTGVHIHISQRPRENTRIQDRWGMTPTQWLETFGLFDGPLFAAHMTAMDFDIDADIMNRRGAVYAHCPSAGGAGASSQPYPEALAAKMNVNIAVDTHSNDMVENMKLAILYGRNRARHLHAASGTPMIMPRIEDAVAGATIVAANGLRRDDLGRIKIGCQSDLTTIEISDFLVGAGALPPDPLNHLLYAHGSQVRHVVIAGKPMVIDGRVVCADQDQVRVSGGRVMTKLWRQLEEENWFDKAPKSPFLALDQSHGGELSID